MTGQKDEQVEKRRKNRRISCNCILFGFGSRVRTPGCLLAFYNTVSRRHINIEETMSCFTDTIIVLAMGDVSKAFAALTDLIAEAGKQSERKQ